MARTRSALVAVSALYLLGSGLGIWLAVRHGLAANSLGLLPGRDTV